MTWDSDRRKSKKDVDESETLEQFLSKFTKQRLNKLKDNPEWSKDLTVETLAAGLNKARSEVAKIVSK